VPASERLFLHANIRFGASERHANTTDGAHDCSTATVRDDRSAISALLTVPLQRSQSCPARALGLRRLAYLIADDAVLSTCSCGARPFAALHRPQADNLFSPLKTIDTHTVFPSATLVLQMSGYSYSLST